MYMLIETYDLDTDDLMSIEDGNTYILQDVTPCLDWTLEPRKRNGKEVRGVHFDREAFCKQWYSMSFAEWYEKNRNNVAQFKKKYIKSYKRI